VALRAWRNILGGLLAVLLAAGCELMPSPEQEGQDVRHRPGPRRRNPVRDQPVGRAAGGRRHWRAAGGRAARALLGRFDAAAGPWEDGVLAASVDQDGAVRLDLAFREPADAGGGLSAARVVMMLCVRLTGTPGPSGEVRLVNLTYPAGSVEAGVVDEVVTLAREGPPPAPEQARHPCLSGGRNDDCAGG
jgi:hypothetical protein